MDVLDKFKLVAWENTVPCLVPGEAGVIGLRAPPRKISWWCRAQRPRGSLDTEPRCLDSDPQCSCSRWIEAGSLWEECLHHKIFKLIPRLKENKIKHEIRKYA